MTPSSSAQGLITKVLALGELPLRVGWLKDALRRGPLSDWTKLSDDICQAAYSGDSGAREVLLTLSISLVMTRDEPLIDELRQLAKEGQHFNLERLLRGEPPTGTSPRKLGSVRIPDYGTGRELTVGERRSLARRPTRDQLEKLLLDPHPLVLDQLFGCPNLTEADVLRVLSRRPAHQAALESVCRHTKWLARRRVRTALIQNPGTPLGISMPLIATVPRDDLDSIVKTTNLPLLVRSAAHELYLRLPPIEPDSPVLM